MRKYPCVTYVMPAYNAAETIKESVDSIFNGNYQDGDEVIIVNDCSTDNTLEIINILRMTYPVIKLVNNKTNKGCPASRNVGISMAKNLYIFNLDSDDVLAPGSRFDLEDYLLTNNADLAAFGESRFFQTNVNEITHRWIYKGGTMNLSDYLASPRVPGGNYIYTKDSWFRVGKYWEYGKGLHEFWGFSLKQIANGSKFVVLPSSFYYHRYGRNSLFVRETRNDNKAISLMATKMIEPFLYLLEEDDARYIMSDSGRTSWFHNLEKHPIHVKGMPSGTKPRVKYHYFNILKVYLRKYIKNLFDNLSFFSSLW